MELVTKRFSFYLIPQQDFRKRAVPSQCSGICSQLRIIRNELSPHRLSPLAVQTFTHLPPKSPFEGGQARCKSRARGMFQPQYQQKILKSKIQPRNQLRGSSLRSRGTSPCIPLQRGNGSVLAPKIPLRRGQARAEAGPWGCSDHNLSKTPQNQNPSTNPPPRQFAAESRDIPLYPPSKGELLRAPPKIPLRRGTGPAQKPGQGDVPTTIQAKNPQKQNPTTKPTPRKFVAKPRDIPLYPPSKGELLRAPQKSPFEGGQARHKSRARGMFQPQPLQNPSKQKSKHETNSAEVRCEIAGHPPVSPFEGGIALQLNVNVLKNTVKETAQRSKAT